MLILGLTGGIGSGKSTVAEMLRRRGAIVIDVDDYGRQVIGPAGRGVEAVVARWGDKMYDTAGGIDRAALAGVVFDDEDELIALNAISHPIINEMLDERVDELGPDSEAIVVMDMAILVESQLGSGTRHPYELVATVEAPIDTRLARLLERGMTESDARARIENQATDDDRRAIAQFVIANGGDLDALRGAVGELWAELQRLHTQKTG
ncbi:MAG: dephospho-CoA kinase [Candidatus Poriferisodalaceae bacterium]|jgi:dephospho-CoA kinase